MNVRLRVFALSELMMAVVLVVDHGSAVQAATMNHYEFGQTLFFDGGMRTKHTAQDDTSTGMPTIMPDSDDASHVFPWCALRVRVQIIRHARTNSVGKYQSCMF